MADSKMLPQKGNTALKIAFLIVVAGLLWEASGRIVKVQWNTVEVVFRPR